MSVKIAVMTYGIIYVSKQNRSEKLLPKKRKKKKKKKTSAGKQRAGEMCL